MQKFFIVSFPKLTNKPGLLSIIFSSFALGAAFGGYIPLQSLWLESLGRTFNEIGITNGILGLGIVISAYFLPRLNIRIGLTKFIISGLFLASLMALLFRFTENLYFWLIIKFFSGVGLGLHWVLSEAWLIKISKPVSRAKVIAFYAISMSLGFAFGPVVIWLFGHTSIIPFVLISIIILIGATPFFFIKRYEPNLKLYSKKSPLKLMIKFPTIMAVCALAGGIDLAMLSLLPALVIRLPDAVPSLVMTLVPVMALGTIIFQYPIAKLTDKYDTAKLSTVITVSGLTCASILPFYLNSFFVANIVAFIGAGLMYGLYTLGLTMLSKRVRVSDLVAANAGFVIVFELSNLIGPTLAGWMIDINLRFGFSIFALSLGALYLVTFWVRHE